MPKPAWVSDPEQLKPLHPGLGVGSKPGAGPSGAAATPGRWGYHWVFEESAVAAGLGQPKPAQDGRRLTPVNMCAGHCTRCELAVYSLGLVMLDRRTRLVDACWSNGQLPKWRHVL